MSTRRPTATVRDGLDRGCLSFAADGSEVRTQHLGGERVVWSTDPAARVRAACRIANRQLSRDERSIVHPEAPWRPTCPGGAAGR